MIESRFKIGLHVEANLSTTSYDTVPSLALLLQIMEKEDPNQLDIEEYHKFTIKFYDTLLENPKEVRLISETLKSYAVAKSVYLFCN